MAVHPHVFRTAIGRHPDIRDYEVRQTERGAVVRVVEGASSVDTAALGSEIVGGLHHAGVPTPQVDVIVVDCLHRTTVGKRRPFIPTRG